MPTSYEASGPLPRAALVTHGIRNLLQRTRKFLFRWYAPLWRQFVDHLRQHLAKTGYWFVARHPGLRHERVDLIGPECFRQIVRRNSLVRPSANPRLCDVSVPALLELLEQLISATTENASGSAAREKATQSPR